MPAANAKASAEDTAAFETAVRAQCKHFASSFAKGDIDDLVDGYYTDNPVMIAPDAPMAKGRSAIKEMFRGMAASGVKGIVLETVQLTIEGSLGYEIGRATLAIDHGGATVEQPGKYLVTWRKCEDGWRVDVDMFVMGALG